MEEKWESGSAAAVRPLRPVSRKDAGTEVTLWDFEEGNYSHAAPQSVCPGGTNQQGGKNDYNYFSKAAAN